LRDIELIAAPGVRLRPVAVPKRRSALLFEQANLAGHSYVASGLLALTLIFGLASFTRARAAGPQHGAAAFAAAVVTGAALLAAVTITGSRTAFFGGALGLLALSGLAARASFMRARRWLLPVLGIVALALAAVLAVQPAGDLLGRLAFWTAGPGDANQVSRVEIWKVALAGIREAPMTGWGAEGFPDLWREHFPADGRAVPQHAHDFWLQLGVAYGLPGILAALWLTGALLVRAVRAGGGAPLLVVVALLAMQLFDHTLTFVGLLLPLTAVLNGSSRTPVQPSSRR
ncbi:MAG TPA: O-antigen ligase family protein, partial [Trueperaceae bacterium]|nr:O-antigen ligase family protein [Trueperaceae bacterium]